MRCAEKVPYDSELLAGNAAWLHGAAYPDCGGVDVYRCRECPSWHIGHPTRAIAIACSTVRKPALWRPARWSRGRRHPSKRPAVR